MSQKFEDTKLLQHPEVRQAYDLYLEAQKSNGDEASDMMLDIAATISQLGANKDPHLVAAALIMPYYMNNSEDAAGVARMEKTFDSLTLEYLESVHVMLHPMGIADIFPELPPTHQRAAVTILAAMQLEGTQELVLNASQMSKRELRAALDEEGDPVMPSFEQMVKWVDLRKHEPKLMGEYDTLRQSLKDIADGKTPKAPKAASTPTP